VLVRLGDRQNRQAKDFDRVRQSLQSEIEQALSEKEVSIDAQMRPVLFQRPYRQD